MGTNYLRDAVCIAFIANEALSILENAGLMGMPIPEVLRQAIDILMEKQRSIQKAGENDEERGIYSENRRICKEICGCI